MNKKQMHWWWVLALGLGVGMAQGAERKWSPAEEAFLAAARKADASPTDMQAMKTLAQVSQQLVNYYVKEEAKINPYDLDARIDWYEQALRTQNPLFDRTYDQRIADLRQAKNDILKRIEQASEEKDTFVRLRVLKELESYKPYLDGITKLEDQTVKELFAEYKKVKDGPPQIEFLKNNLVHVKSAVGAKFFALVYNDFKAETAALMKNGRPLEAGAQADLALQLWPTDNYFRETARQTVENF